MSMNKDPSSPVSKTPNDKVDGDWKVVGKGGIPKHAENLPHPPQRCTSPRKEKKDKLIALKKQLDIKNTGQARGEFGLLQQIVSPLCHLHDLATEKR